MQLVQTHLSALEAGAVGLVGQSVRHDDARQVGAHKPARTHVVTRPKAHARNTKGRKKRSMFVTARYNTTKYYYCRINKHSNDHGEACSWW